MLLKENNYMGDPGSTKLKLTSPSQALREKCKVPTLNMSVGYFVYDSWHSSHFNYRLYRCMDLKKTTLKQYQMNVFFQLVIKHIVIKHMMNIISHSIQPKVLKFCRLIGLKDT